MIRHRTIAERPFGWDFGSNQFFRASNRGRLIKARPPLFGKHRGGFKPSQGEPEESGPGEFDPNGEPEEIPFGEPQEDSDEEGLVEDENGEFEIDGGDEEFDSEADRDALAEDDEEEEDEEEKFELPPLPIVAKSVPFYENIENTVVRQFPSWYDFVSCAADMDLQSWGDNHNDDSGHMGSGVDSFEQAVEMALTRGWPEGRELFYDALVAIPARKQTFESEIYEVAGPIPIMQLYVTGDPACMQDWQQDRKANNPIIKINVSIARSWHIETQTIANRGAAVVSLANRLELEGHSVEINFCDYRRGDCARDFYCQVAFKKAGEQLDLDRAAMALAHAATFRKFCFALVQQSPELCAGFDICMGYPNQRPFEPLLDLQTIFIPSPISNETLEESRAAVELAASKFFTETQGDLQ